MQITSQSAVGATVLLVASSLAHAQQTTVGTPLRGSGSGFFEHVGIGFGFQHVTPNGIMFFQHGGGLTGWPPFGGFNPSLANTFGVGGRSGDFRWNLTVSALQGSSTSSFSSTPYLTLENGGFGFINNSVQRPFVSSFVPIVNANPEMQREWIIQRYRESASAYVVERQKKQQADVLELDRLRMASDESLRRKRFSNSSTRQSEPALRLGSAGP